MKKKTMESKKMGFYFRKSKNIGGLRFNFSKSGIGVSTGVKGVRVGTGPHGNYINIGANGIYYRKTWGNKRKNNDKFQRKQTVNKENNYKIENVEEIESGNVIDIVDSSSEELVNELNTKLKKFSFKWLSLLFLVIPMNSDLNSFLFIVSLLIFDIIDKKRKNTIIFYDIDENEENRIQQFYDSFRDILKSNKKWHIKSRINNYNIKQSYGGASTTVNQKNISIKYKTPPYVKTNVKSICIPVGKQKLYFFPDRILIYEKKNIGGLDYCSLNIESYRDNFVWTSGIKPFDSEVVRYTYAHVNTNGTPDRRFVNNPQIPVLNFTKIRFYSDNGLNEEIILSRPNAGDALKNELNKMRCSNNYYKDNTKTDIKVRDNNKKSKEKWKRVKTNTTGSALNKTKDDLKDKMRHINYLIQVMDDNNLGYHDFVEKYCNENDSVNNTRDIFKFSMFVFINYIVNSNLLSTDFDIIKKYLGTNFGNTNIENEYAFNQVFGKEYKNKKVDPIDWYCFYMQNDELVKNNLLINKDEKILDALIEVYREIGLKIAENGYDYEQRIRRYNQYMKYCNSKLSELKGEMVSNQDAPNIENKNNDDSETLEELIEQLNSLIGLENVKNDVNSLINLVKVRKIREEKKIKQDPMSLHLVFSGNPGTGKTTVARLIAKIYHKMGVLSEGNFVETDRSDLVGGYVGQTAIKVKEVCNKAIGGLLFIDEAYSLSSNKDSNDFGKEAIETLLKFMEDNRDNFIIIVAGYTELMEDFLNSNPGLKSRFNKYIYFEDYTPSELLEIYKKLCKDSELKLSKEAEQQVKEFFELRYNNRTENFANARDVRNFFEKTLVNQANRISADNIISNDELQAIELEDVKNIKLKS